MSPSYVNSKTKIFQILCGFPLLCICLCLHLETAAGNITDLHALLDFKSNIVEDPYHIMNSWNDSIHHCNWTGITCNIYNERVMNLNLGLQRLGGTVTPSIGNLTFLTILDLSVNSFHSGFPQEVGRLLYLQQLFIDDNNFDGNIPSNLSQCTQLIALSAARNNLIGNIPKNIGILNLLTILNFEGNRLGTRRSLDLSFLDYLVNCTVLEDLRLQENNFGGEIPNSIANLSTKLNLLHLGSNGIWGNIPVEIGKLSNLTILGLEMNQISGSVPDALGMLQNLQELYLEGNKFSGGIPYALGMLQNLQELYLEGNKFSGGIPFSIGNLSSLTKLNLEWNYFDGSIPSSLGKCQHLVLLDLSNNKLTGTIPMEVISIPSLKYLNVSSNNLLGALPNEVDKCFNIGELDLSENNFSGVIPSFIGSCTGLGGLYLQGNYFEGNIPQTLQNLEGLQDIDLSRNYLSGKIPTFLGDFKELQRLNLSYNDLEGEIPKNGTFKNANVISIYGNKKLCGGVPELNLPACTFRKVSLRIFLEPKVLIPLVTTFVFLLFLSCVFASFMVKRARVKASRSEDFRLEFSYSLIAKCSGGFSQDNLIGSGSFGSVYKGTLPNDGPTIAIKVLNLEQRGASRSFIDECKVMKNIRHRNLLKIITAISCVDYQGNDFKALVFEFMSNGNLECWLHPTNNMQYQTKTLTFIQRLNIAIDVACALEYLHHSCQNAIVHCDIKPHNVLLDNDMVAHVGDFGLATFLFEESSNFSIQSIMSASLKGSIGYIPPEYGMGGKPSILGDIYSYGILLLEIFTGKRPTDDAFEGGMGIQQFIAMALPNHVMDIIDPSMFFEQELDDENQFEGEENALRREFDIEVEARSKGLMKDDIVSLIQIGVSCSATSPSERMHINEVVNKLHAIKKSFIRIKHKRTTVT